MARDIVSPNEVDLETSGRRDYWAALGHTSVWGSHLIPLTVIVGPQAKPGEGLVAFGGNHGNEYEGPVAIKHLLREIRTEDVQGRLVLVPVLNVAAFRAGTRESTGDDGYNLNRVFVEGAGTTPPLAGITHRIAAFVRQCIWPHVHISIDLHSGGEVARFAHWAGFFTCHDAELNERREQMARWFGAPIVMSGPNRPLAVPPEDFTTRPTIWANSRLARSWALALPRTCSACATPARGCWRRLFITVSCAVPSNPSATMRRAPRVWCRMVRRRWPPIRAITSR